jgi:hypothetical protein
LCDLSNLKLSGTFSFRSWTDVGQKIGVLCSKYCPFLQNLNHNYGFQEKRHFCRKLAKVADNCDYNIDPLRTRRAPTKLACLALDVKMVFLEPLWLSGKVME